MEYIYVCQNTENNLSLYLSIIAIVISIITIIYNIHLNRSQLRKEFFDEHFKETLDKLLPKARERLFFKKEKLTNYEDMQKVLAKTRQNADFFKYYSPKFYNSFKHCNQDIEDYIGETLNKNCDEERQTRFFQIIDKKIQKLYKIITQEYFG